MPRVSELSSRPMMAHLKFGLRMDKRLVFFAAVSLFFCDRCDSWVRHLSFRKRNIELVEIAQIIYVNQSGETK